MYQLQRFRQLSSQIHISANAGFSPSEARVSHRICPRSQLSRVGPIDCVGLAPAVVLLVRDLRVLAAFPFLVTIQVPPSQSRRGATANVGISEVDSSWQPRRTLGPPSIRRAALASYACVYSTTPHSRGSRTTGAVQAGGGQSARSSRCGHVRRTYTSASVHVAWIAWHIALICSGPGSQPYRGRPGSTRGPVCGSSKEGAERYGTYGNSCLHNSSQIGLHLQGQNQGSTAGGVTGGSTTSD